MVLPFQVRVDFIKVENEFANERVRITKRRVFTHDHLKQDNEGILSIYELEDFESSFRTNFVEEECQVSSFRVAVPVELNLAVTQEPVDAQHVRRPPLHQLALLVCRKVTQADDVISAFG